MIISDATAGKLQVPPTGLVPLPLPAGFINFSDGSIQNQSDITTAKIVYETIQVNDWKNHTCRKGDIYRIFFKVNAPLQELLKGTSSMMSKYLVPPWPTSWKIFSGKAGEFAKYILNNLLEFSDSTGIVKNKITVQQVQFIDNFGTLQVKFTVKENPFPIMWIVGAIFAILTMSYLSVREVRQYLIQTGKTPPPPEPPAPPLVKSLDKAVSMAGIIAALFVLYGLFMKK